MGLSRPSRLDALLAAVRADLPEELFAGLAELLPSREHWLDFRRD